MTTFGARLHAAIARPRPALRRHRPARRAAARLGARRRRRRARAVRADRGRGAGAARVAVVKPQSAFYERFGSRGIAVLERLVIAVPRRRRAGAARRQARRHRLDQPGVRRRLPRPVLARWRSTRSPPAPTSASARSTRWSTPRGKHDAGVFVLALTSNKEGPEVQEARSRRRHRRRRRARPPARAQRGAEPLGSLRRRRRRDHRRRRPPASTSTARSSRPGTARRAARVADLRRIFGAAARHVLPEHVARAAPVPARRAAPTPPTGSTTSSASCAG